MFSKIIKCARREKMYCLGVLAILSGFLFLGQVLVWLLYPYNPLDFYEQPYPILNENKTVKIGESAVFRMEFQKNTDEPGLINQSIYCEDGSYLSLSRVGTTRKAGYFDQNIGVYVPPNAPTGKCKMVFGIEYEVNPIRHVIEYAESELFEIVK